jgi:hypothetical protein
MRIIVFFIGLFLLIQLHSAVADSYDASTGNLTISSIDVGSTTYSKGYLQFDYVTRDGSARTMTFYIEDDGIESLQLKSSGAWFKGKFGEKQVMTLYLTRVGP